MTYSFVLIAVPLIAILALVASVVWVTSRRLWSEVSLRGLVIAIIPSLIMLGSFYILALHMYLSLGGWPKSIGNAGLSAALVRHANITCSYFGIILLVALVGLPISLLICSLVPRLRSYLAHLAAGGIAFVLCLAAMHLGPSEFLSWWWD